MQSDLKNGSVSKASLWTGRIMSGVVVLFMLFDSITKIIKADQVLKASTQLGYPAETIPVIEIILLICVIFYIIPYTSILGAVLLTGYLGGAVASNLRIETPLFSNILFPVYMGILAWGGIFLRDVYLRRFFPLRKTED
ncbi:MAG: DoxX family protein [Ignavibacteriaceae bacterium]|nr:DoxX family protein [Ignavibacteriaceae bacterium]